MISTSIEFHALTFTIMRCHVPHMQNKFIEYRSQTHFNKTPFLESVADSNLRSCLTLEDPEDEWRLFTNNFKSTIDKHAAINKVRSNQPPYISTHMRKAIWIQKRLYKKYITNRNGDTWEKYRTQKNCVDMRRKAMRATCLIEPRKINGIFGTL